MKNDTYAYDVSSLDGFSFWMEAHDFNQPFSMRNKQMFHTAFWMLYNVVYIRYEIVRILSWKCRREESQMQRNFVRNLQIRARFRDVWLSKLLLLLFLLFAKWVEHPTIRRPSLLYAFVICLPHFHFIFLCSCSLLLYSLFLFFNFVYSHLHFIHIAIYVLIFVYLPLSSVIRLPLSYSFC